MTPEQLFSMANLIAMAAWIALVILPRRRRVTDVIAGGAVPLMFAAAYLVIVAATFGRSPGGFGSLADVATLFDNRWMLLAGWIHYLAFDLLVGTWEVRDARERGLPHLLVVPCLVLTFLIGPAGWLLYRGVALTKSSQMRQSRSSLA